ncbi:hypothetical protein J7J64_00630 [Lysobacter sp. ISL-42]|nr:hypothetical protein [Lysobacter sp. ISL-42]
MTRGLLRLVVLLGACGWSTLSAASLEAPQYHHTAWSMEQGAPVDVWALAQGSDGYLWLGTGTGLYRFDGLQFELQAPPASYPFVTTNITSLHMGPDDRLWIGFLLGGISMLHKGRFTHYTGDAMPTAMVLGFVTDRDGAVWAASTSGLSRFDGRRWAKVGQDWGYPSDRADALLLDSHGTLWASTGNTLVYLPRGERRFRPSGESVSHFASLGFRRRSPVRRAQWRARDDSRCRRRRYRWIGRYG